MHRRIALALAATLAAAPIAALPSIAHADEGGDPALTLRVPAKTIGYAYGNGKRRSEVPINAGLRTGTDPFEIWATRPSYDEGVKVVWKSPDGDVELPAGSMRDFAGLHHFLKITIKHLDDGRTATQWKDLCLNSYESQRARPDAPAYSPYPYDCSFNPYSLGGVQGIQAGWTSSVLGYNSPLRLFRGKYDVTVSIAPAYVEAFGLDPADVTAKTRVIVKKGGGEEEPGPVGRSTEPRPLAKAPTGAQTSDQDALEGPVPDLRSLPAWGISVSPNGDNLVFGATVWNAGDSPLVVDGFRVDGEDEMDGYQYFFDSDGNQTGYQHVGHFHWDPKPSHQHWHFKDFARYTLLREDGSQVVRSRKEAFCLANTDFVDATVTGAAWRQETDDLSTACGDYDSQSLREVLASGWGDTYTQYRAGQAFRLNGLPNGTYFIEVRANPNGRLVERNTDDNVSLRKIIIGGKPGARTVEVPKIGIIDEPDNIFK